jgi:AcrR family transcriptional regulator
VAEAGPKAFTLREVARRAGVSHNAPYRHFRDKDDLLRAVAAQGFELLTESMLEEMRAGRDAAERLRLAGRGYVRFALRWPQHIAIMFDLPVAAPQAGQRAFDTLLDAIAAVQAEGGLPPGDPLPLAVVCWSAVHGLAKLAIGGRLPFDAAGTIEFSDYVTRSLTHGMKDLPQTPRERLT